MTIRMSPLVRRVLPSEPFAWRGPLGLSYATRNPSTAAVLDDNYRQRFGVSRSDMARRFLRFLPLTVSVLEVGSSNGVQLAVLRGLGFTGRMVGLDVCREAMAGAGEPAVVGDGEALPFPARSFDLVFTSGTLMHVPFGLRGVFCREILRVTRRWVWGFEPWSEAAKPLLLDFHGLVPQGWVTNEPVSYLQLEPLRLLDQEWWPDSPY